MIMLMDTKVFDFLNGLYGKSHFFDLVFKILSEYLIYIIPLFLIIYWFVGSKKIALQAFIAGAVSWCGFAYLIGHLYFRSRPFVSLPQNEVLFHRPTYSFPSDHATFLFAVAFSFYLAGKRTTSYYLFAIGAIISIARVTVGFHWPTDILAGWALGIFVAYLIYLIRDPLDQYIINPIIWLAKKIKLA